MSTEFAKAKHDPEETLFAVTSRARNHYQTKYAKGVTAAAEAAQKLADRHGIEMLQGARAKNTAAWIDQRICRDDYASTHVAYNSGNANHAEDNWVDVRRFFRVPIPADLTSEDPAEVSRAEWYAVTHADEAWHAGTCNCNPWDDQHANACPARGLTA